MDKVDWLRLTIAIFKAIVKIFNDARVNKFYNDNIRKFEEDN